MSNSAKKVWNIFTSILIALVVVLAFLLAGTRLFGLHPMKVLSGSMEPEIHTGALVYVKDVDTATLKRGDVITYMLSEDTYSTHRITEVVPDEDDPGVIRFRTKGDANKAEDGGLVLDVNVVGEVQFSIPLLGYISDFIQNPPGTYVAIAIGVLLLLLIFLPEILGGDDEKTKGEKAKKEKAAKDEAADSEEPAASAPESVADEESDGESKTEAEK